MQINFSVSRRLADTDFVIVMTAKPGESKHGKAHYGDTVQ